MRPIDAILATIRAHPEGITTYDLARAVYPDAPFWSVKPATYDKARKLAKYGLVSLRYEKRPGVDGAPHRTAVWIPEGDTEPPGWTVNTRDMVEKVVADYPVGYQFTARDVAFHIAYSSPYRPDIRQVVNALRGIPGVVMGHSDTGRATGVWTVTGGGGNE